MEIFSKLGLDPLHFIAQLINVAIVLIVLRVVLYRPIHKILRERREKIQKGLSDAEQARKRLAEVEAEIQAKRVDARQEESKLLQKARAEGKQTQAEYLVGAKKEAAAIIENAKETAKLRKEQALEDARKQVAGISIQVAERILNEEIDAEKHQKLINHAIKEL